MLLFLPIALFLVASDLRAQDRVEARAQKFLLRHDRNQDGVITADEWKGPQRLFEKIDKNGDGKLVLEEIQVLMAKREKKHRQKGKKSRLAAFFQRYDKDGDGRISPQELDLPPVLFERLDLNGDGYLTFREIKKLKELQIRKKVGILYHLDTNKDKKVSQKEWLALLDFTLKKLDKNGDGFLTKDELKKRKKLHWMLKNAARQLKRAFSHIDQDGDQRLSREELRKIYLKIFQEQDKNHDGFISFHEALLAKRGRKHRKMKGEHSLEFRVRILFERADKDGDGRISKEEYAHKEEFDKIDKNRDGYLTPNEVAQFYLKRSSLPPSSN